MEDQGYQCNRMNIVVQILTCKEDCLNRNLIKKRLFWIEKIRSRRRIPEISHNQGCVDIAKERYNLW